jgi:hypothetical protein
MNTSDHNGWLSFDDALTHTGRSPATLRRAVVAGKISKTTISLPGRRPEVHLSREDLDKVFGQRTHIPSVVITDRDHEQSGVITTDRMANAALPPVLTDLVEALTRPQVELRDKLCWTMREARTMTGLSRPALRELIEREPDLAIRRGGRVRWVRAEKLRAVLS